MSVPIGAGAGTSLAGLGAELARLAGLGFTAAELNPENLDCIFGGRVHQGQLAQVVEACSPFTAPTGKDVPPGRLALTVHSPAVLDLRHPTLGDLHRDILLSTVAVAAAIGARVVVVHYERRSASEAIEQQYRRSVEAAAVQATKHGITLGIENIEIERAEYVLDFLRMVGDPAVRMTYDFGHDFLASAHFGYTYLNSVAACAPHAVHTHLSDNFGRFDTARLGDFRLYKAIPARNISVAGMGDTHLPVGWGVLPYAGACQAFNSGRADPYSGVVLGEHRRNFAAADGEVLATLRRLAEMMG